MSENPENQTWEGARHLHTPRRKPKRNGPVLSGVVLAFIALGVVRCALQSSMEIRSSSPPERISETFDKDMTTQALAPWRDEILRDFPPLYVEMRRTFIMRIQSGDARPEAMRAAIKTASDFGRAHIGAVPQASERALAALVAQNAASMKTFGSAGEEACAHFVVTGGAKGSATDLLLAVTRRNAAMFHAIHDGETAPVKRAALTASELATFRSALASRGLAPNLIQTVFEGGLEQLSAADQCKTGTVAYGVLAGMPAATAAKITAALTASGG
ncbi:hypothetical protein QO010_002657 [Caulobacter ginsengisoli]|uniref:Uncharacterized protein n=1 Tax=Caulobacter ginsengisoli TaxID=400775 RepID=A0ABU0IS87_9CAUL|nr:hypothetical protein [Caulobacter ginsengisoli]MDQ0464873.1 hypothetical protein [Caulobacter ginsengisoli]